MHVSELLKLSREERSEELKKAVEVDVLKIKSEMDIVTKFLKGNKDEIKTLKIKLHQEFAYNTYFFSILNELDKLNSVEFSIDVSSLESDWVSVYMKDKQFRSEEVYDTFSCLSQAETFKKCSAKNIIFNGFSFYEVKNLICALKKFPNVEVVDLDNIKGAGFEPYIMSSLLNSLGLSKLKTLCFRYAEGSRVPNESLERATGYQKILKAVAKKLPNLTCLSFEGPGVEIEDQKFLAYIKLESILKERRVKYTGKAIKGLIQEMDEIEQTKEQLKNAVNSGKATKPIEIFIAGLDESEKQKQKEFRESAQVVLDNKNYSGYLDIARVYATIFNDPKFAYQVYNNIPKSAVEYPQALYAIIMLASENRIYEKSPGDEKEKREIVLLDPDDRKAISLEIEKKIALTTVYRAVEINKYYSANPDCRKFNDFDAVMKLGEAALHYLITGKSDLEAELKSNRIYDTETGEHIVTKGKQIAEILAGIDKYKPTLFGGSSYKPQNKMESANTDEINKSCNF